MHSQDTYKHATKEDLHQAIVAEDLTRIQALLDWQPALIKEETTSGIPLYFEVARTGCLDIVTYLVEYAWIDLSETDKNHRTLLHYVAMSGNVDSARYLVERAGFSVVAGDSDLVTPYHIAHHAGYAELESYFQEVCGVALHDMYQNPILSGAYPDPSIVRVGEDYYMVNSTFVFFPCIPISHSKDLIHWKTIGYAITNPEWADLDGLEGGRGYWAPDISYHKGRFYIAVTYRMNDTGPVYRKQVIVSSDKPEGPYGKPAIIHEDGIDPSLFVDNDGKRYMLLNRGARILPLNDHATEQIGESRLLYYGEQKHASEGPHLLRKDGYYYLFLAEGGTGMGHRITVARSKTLFGTYEPCPHNPIMRQNDTRATIQRCGHGKPVMTQHGDWYMVYLCARMAEGSYSLMGRETALDPIEWTQDGWPMVNRLAGPSVLQKKPNLSEHLWEQPSLATGNASTTHVTPNTSAVSLGIAHSANTDQFESVELGLDWLFARAPELEGYALQQNTLWLKGSTAPLSSIDARNILVRRRQDPIFEAETCMGLVPMTTGQHAGMISYYDENSWIQFGVFQEDHEGQKLQVVEHFGASTQVAGSFVQISESTRLIYLRVRTRYLQKEFFYSLDGATYHKLCTLDKVTYLYDEGLSMGKRFTGPMVGLYAYAGTVELRVPFSCFSYRPIDVVG